MHKNLLNLFACSFLLSACSSTPPQISLVCEENNVGNSIIKWETTPRLQGSVKVYASTNPEFIAEVNPVAMANIEAQRITVINHDPKQRYYYKLVFNERHRVKTAPRNIIVPGIQNFRDLGGYPSHETRRDVRWGMLYRSARIDSLTICSEKELKNIGIKTIIDLRAPQEKVNKQPLNASFKSVSIPIETRMLRYILHDIQAQKIKSDTLYRLVEQMNREMITKYTSEYRRIFDVLLEEDNYPVVFHCDSGKGRTGVVSALVLAALGVNQDLIVEDYRLSNRYFDIPSASQEAYHLPSRSQEAITTFYSAKEEFLNASYKEINRRYGDIDLYLQKGVGLSKEEIKKLQSILLEKR